jgi:hypothetical protein
MIQFRNGVICLKMYVLKPILSIAIVMISPHPNDPLAVWDLFNKIQDPFMRRLQFFIGIVYDIAI